MGNAPPASIKPGMADSLALLPEAGVRELAALLCLPQEHIEPCLKGRKRQASNKTVPLPLSPQTQTVFSSGGPPSTYPPSSPATTNTHTHDHHAVRRIRPSAEWLASQRRALHPPDIDVSSSFHPESDGEDSDDEETEYDGEAVSSTAAPPSSSASGDSTAHVRRPGGLRGLRMSFLEGARRALLGYQPVKLCGAHGRLNPRLVRDVFVALSLEATLRADGVRAHYDDRAGFGYRSGSKARVVAAPPYRRPPPSGGESDEGEDEDEDEEDVEDTGEWAGVASRAVRDWGDRLMGLASLWCEPRAFDKAAGRVFPAAWRCGRLESGCMACMIAVVGGRRDALVDLRAGMLARRREGGGGGRGGGRLLLLPLVEAWIDGYDAACTAAAATVVVGTGGEEEEVEEEEVDAAVAARSESAWLAGEIRIVRDYQKAVKARNGPPVVKTIPVRTREGFRVPMARRGRRRRGDERRVGFAGGDGGDGVDTAGEDRRSFVRRRPEEEGGRREYLRPVEHQYGSPRRHHPQRVRQWSTTTATTLAEYKVRSWNTSQGQDEGSDDEEQDVGTPVQAEEIARRATIFAELEEQAERQEYEHEGRHVRRSATRPGTTATTMPLPHRTTQVSSPTPSRSTRRSSSKTDHGTWTSAVSPTVFQYEVPPSVLLPYQVPATPPPPSSSSPAQKEPPASTPAMASSVYSNDWPAMPHAPPAPSTVLSPILASPRTPRTGAAASGSRPLTTPPRAPRMARRFHDVEAMERVDVMPSPTPLRKRHLAQRDIPVAEGEWDRSTVLPEDSISCVLGRRHAGGGGGRGGGAGGGKRHKKGKHPSGKHSSGKHSSGKK
ncbi:uncharacterized protein E0L32_005752 [Thyridium curvatum]|uniref:Uncharacterized protein n=1 Tax=Thyridium curvatum TaxID=1093900 RepID=A0A507BAJ9_9PEZI|nr:uncharacterized protein E0L32_005752 [Thyridium curvatum]TPX13808.1 hypothetical protein E0L32_005752 [Thyridium curvatum]